MTYIPLIHTFTCSRCKERKTFENVHDTPEGRMCLPCWKQWLGTLTTCPPGTILAFYELLQDVKNNDYAPGECDCRPEPENQGHVCNLCKALAIFSLTPHDELP